MKGKRVKIFKTATNMSILDVTSALNYYTRNKNEEVYKGSVVFTINEYGRSKENLRAFVSKTTIKMVLNLIIQNNFYNFYPNGFREFGGTAYKKEARTFSIRFDPQSNRFIFQIDYGIGEVMNTGAIKMVKREKSVQSYLSYEETLKMANEVLDFIRHAELTAMMNGKPLNTIMHMIN